MNFLVVKDGTHPTTGQPIKKSQIVDVWHEIGKNLCTGSDPLLKHTLKVTPETADTLKRKNEEDYAEEIEDAVTEKEIRKAGGLKNWLDKE